jgi:hypothetical protein
VGRDRISKVDRAGTGALDDEEEARMSFGGGWSGGRRRDGVRGRVAAWSAQVNLLKGLRTSERRDLG